MDNKDKKQQKKVTNVPIMVVSIVPIWRGIILN